MYSDQDGRGKKVIFVFKRQVGEYVSIVFVSVRVVQDDLHYLHIFAQFLFVYYMSDIFV